MALAYDVYGFRLKDIEGIAADIGLLLGYLFISRRDEILGRYYQAGKISAENLDLLYNNSDYDQYEWMEPAFKEFPSILYVNQTKRSEEIKTMILEQFEDKVALLHHREYTRQIE